MRFNNTINEYIDGEKFSSGLDVFFSSEKYDDQTRIEKILRITKGKKIIHLGCADHLPLIEEKIRTKRWLHGLLTENTQECIGIDNNQEAVEFINKKLGIDNVFCADIFENVPEQIKNTEWDYLILGELIEHVDNPVLFLQELRKKFQGSVKKLLITAPNVYNIDTIRDIKRNCENINTDHRYWFSPFTLTKVVHISGFGNCEISFAERLRLPRIQAIVRRIKLLFGIPSQFTANCFLCLILTADFDERTR